MDAEVLSAFGLDVHEIQACCYLVPCFSSSVLNVRFVRFVHVAYDSNLLCILPLKQYMHIPQCVCSLCYQLTSSCFLLEAERHCCDHSCPEFCYRHAEASLVCSLRMDYWVTIFNFIQFSSVHFSHSVVYDSLWPHESQHTRPPCPSPTPRVYSNSCPSSRWCHPTISSSVVPFSSCPQSLPASGYFPMSQLFAWGGQSTGVSASASVLPMNTQDWSPSGWTGWISLQSKGLSRVFSSTTVII